MASRLLDWLRYPARRPWRALVLALIFLLLGYLGWFAGSELWVRHDRAEAARAIEEYDFADARRRLDRCVRLRPGDPELRLLAARTARRDGDPDASERHLDAYHDLVGGSPPTEVVERALLLAQQGKVREVIDYLLQALEEHHPQTEHILEALAMGSVQGYQLHRATFWSNELLQKWPKNGIGQLVRAETIDTQGNRDKAMAQLRDLVEDYPKFFKARSTLAAILFKARRYREAAAEYAVLLRQQPDDLAALLGLASSYERLGGTEEARPLLERLLERYPDNSEVLLECGRFAMNDKRLEDAERLLRRAAELAPYDHEVHRELGACLGQLNKTEESKRHLDRSRQIEADLILMEKTLVAMSMAPNDPKPRREVGQICLRNGQVSEGLRWLYGVLDSTPDDKPTHQILADFFASHGDPDRARYHRDKAQ